MWHIAMRIVMCDMYILRLMISRGPALWGFSTRRAHNGRTHVGTLERTAHTFYKSPKTIARVVLFLDGTPPSASVSPLVILVSSLPLSIQSNANRIRA